jgi:predicted amidohydrolase YtcJ
MRRFVSDVILYNGSILTMDERRPRATALVVRDARVLAVGGDGVLALRRDATEVVDLRGRTVSPGFIDAHHHITLAAWYARGVDLLDCRSVAEALERVSAGVADASDNGWFFAYNYSPRHFGRGHGLTRADLDRVAGDLPVLVMHFSFHEAIVSSAGLRAAGIDRSTPDPFGGRIVRDRGGEPTGELLETAVGPVEALARLSAAEAGYEQWVMALEQYCQGLFAAGITHICDPGIDAMLEGYVRRARREGRLPLPVQMLFVSKNGLFQPPMDRLDGPVTGEFVDGVPIGALKLFADGGSRCAVCVGLGESLAGVASLVGRAVRSRHPGLLLAASAPERPHWGEDHRLHVGYLHYPPGELASLCAVAHERGFQLAIHAACNAGIEETIRALAGLSPGPYRHRVEHLVSLDRDQMRRLADLGVIGVVQPTYIAQLGDEWEAMPAAPRLKSVPLRDLHDAGIPLAGSSDAPIAPYSPLAGMRAAITRRTANGLTHQADQAITPLEALRLWTTGGALAANLPGEIGVLCAGARADLVILSANPLETPPEALDTIRVERTILGGKTVYDARDGASS